MSKKEVSEKNILGSYITGFILSAILMVLAYYIVDKHSMSVSGMYISLTIITVVLLFVQSAFFLRLNTSSEDSMWDLFTFLFTIIVIAIVVIGTLWIMYNLNYNMVH